ncbi:complexin-4-like [Lampetra fluviatilis]
MAFMIKSMVGGQLKNLTGGGGGGEEAAASEGAATPAEAQGMTREEFEEYQKQVVEEKMERDAMYASKKAGRATVRVELRKKYRLPKSEQDEAQITMAGDDVELPDELARMVRQDEEEEEDKESFAGRLHSLQEMDIDTIKEKAQETFNELKTSVAEHKCRVM